MNIKAIVPLIVLLALVGCAQESGAPTAANENSPAAASGQAGPAGASGGSDIDTLVANADPAMGQRQFIYCQACHTTEAGGGNKVGPNLSGFVGRDAAQADGFIYSSALTESGLVWDNAALDQWIENPAAMVPGTTMVFAGIMDPQQRANLIAYLQEATR